MIDCTEFCAIRALHAHTYLVPTDIKWFHSF